jgi:hypothetical protein
VISSTATLMLNAFTVQSSVAIDACRSARIRSSAVATTSWSSATMKAAVAVRPSAQRWVEVEAPTESSSQYERPY